MLLFSLFIVVLLAQIPFIQSHCQKTPLCHYNSNLMTITCNRAFAEHNITVLFPDVSCFPPVNTYLFLNFQQIQWHTFENITFPENDIFKIKLINISIIETEAFSGSIHIPDSSRLTIEIGDSQTTSDIIIQPDAFNRIKIEHLYFRNLNSFNGQSIFDANSFGNDLDVNVLLFDQCNLTGFSNLLHKTANINHLSIRNSPSFVQIADLNLSSLLTTSKSLEISNTGLQMINAHTFPAWSLILQELILTNNSNFEIFPSTFVDGVLMKLNKLDLSYNSIHTIDINYNWFAYSYAKELLLRNQQLDLFLKSNILKTLPFLQKIDFSGGFIGENKDDLIRNHFFYTTNLTSIDISYTNLTEPMIIDLLTHISQTANRLVDIYLAGHQLTDENFCSYFTIYKNAPKLLNLLLDESHKCNCIIELFYRDTVPDTRINNSILHPSCLLDASRQRCDIQAQLALSKCSLGGQNPEPSHDDNNNIGDYAFGAIVAGVVVVLLVMLSLGYGVYQRRRRGTELTMDQPVENPLAAIIEERLENV
ncbi:hypothetical protein I4U23_025243 [Adineta vaga]|nr:hypothetical protein I4U23_025243 [Adineta vaga]